MREWNDIAVIAPTSDIDISSVPLLREQVDTLIESGMRRILINCRNVKFIDSTGVAFLVSRARRLMRDDGMLSIENVSTAVARFLQIARLLDALHVTPGRPSAGTGAFSRRAAAMEQEHLGAGRY